MHRVGSGLSEWKLCNNFSDDLEFSVGFLIDYESLGLGLLLSGKRTYIRFSSYEGYKKWNESSLFIIDKIKTSIIRRLMMAK
ncbi:MAG: hypothetical protein U5K84_08860 [Alkalibacterium sp.]|nr:hypothetical protein [Alkalibacterium sp.]